MKTNDGGHGHDAGGVLGNMVAYDASNLGMRILRVCALELPLALGLDGEGRDAVWRVSVKRMWRGDQLTDDRGGAGGGWSGWEETGMTICDMLQGGCWPLGGEGCLEDAARMD